jgi:ribosome-associated toxin RatA of RatAB toxin-antitoxin module
MLVSAPTREATMRRVIRAGSERRIAAGLVLALAAAAAGAPAARAAEATAHASAHVAAPADAVWALLSDFSRWERTFPSIASLRVERVGEHELRLHTTTRAAGRSVRYTLAARVDPARRRIDCALDPAAPSDVRALASSWQVREAPDGGALVELRVRSESGLAVPGFLERRMTALSTRQSVDALVAAAGAARRPATTLLASAE